jgi:hypothetical protein
VAGLLPVDVGAAVVFVVVVVRGVNSVRGRCQFIHIISEIMQNVTERE